MKKTACSHILNQVLTFFDLYLKYEDLWLSHKAAALVSFEHGGDILNADLSIVGPDMTILAVAQEDEQKAVCV